MIVDLKNTRRASNNPLKFNFKMSIVDGLHCKKSDLHSNTINVFNRRFANLRPILNRKWKHGLSKWKTRKSKSLRKVTMHDLQNVRNNFDVVFEPDLSNNFAIVSNTVKLDYVQNTIVAVSVLRKTLHNSCNKNLKLNFVKRRMILKSVCEKTSNWQLLVVVMNSVSRFRNKSKRLTTNA